MLNKLNKSETKFKSKDKKLILSIAMCTFNGADYLTEQLDSIVKQTRLPDELIVCDDNSADITLQILNKFRKIAPFQVKIYNNTERLGSTKNFEKAINLCQGDVIALSDQDDLWLPHKIEKLENIFKSNHNIGYVFSDALIVDEQLHSLGYTMWEGIHFSIKQRDIFKQGHQVEVLFKHNVVTGSTMAIKSEIKNLILPISEKWIHDAWIALLVSAAGINGNFIEESLIKYRQHSTQLIGGKKFSFSEQLRKTYNIKSNSYSIMAKQFEDILDRLILMDKLKANTKLLINSKIKHLQTRQNIHEISHLKRFYWIFKELFSKRYHKFSNGWKSVAKDLLY